MSAETVREGQKPLAVVLTPEEANAIVYTVAFLAVAAAEDLDLMAVSIRPPDLLAISARCARVGRLAAINDQLAWSCQRSGKVSRL